ncbi:GNAT family N-acetyltransferase [Halonotius terrestris]|uniref:GNAT family N-acetyltransferase n=1 Tax=Halonotius terrestris TaxID=2487750 RepID=A0A8J8TBF0_9EURY|nr:GNAT family N-acetyltransferase [Halonotius terrestris]TQQ81125.1 GNAT family N-acetyltransferase [Halonotius terrestris]
MEFALLGWAAANPSLRLDYRRFSYAGKFVTGGTGVAVIRGEPDGSATEANDTTTDDSSTDDDSETDNADTLASLPDGLEASDFADDILAAIAFSPDRTEPSTLKIRYLTVRDDLRGDGQQLGPKLVAFLTSQAAAAGYDRIAIAVNNAFSYHALYKAGFTYTDRETGLAELVLDRSISEPAIASQSGYQRGLDVFRDREGLSTAENEFLGDHSDAAPPGLLSAIDDP